MPLLPVSVAPRIAPSARTTQAPLAAALALPLAALVAVVAGFGLVAASILGWSSLSTWWGLGLACSGWGLVRLARERTPRLRD